MYAEELLSALPLKKIIGVLPDQVTDIVIDSRSVQPNSMFVCIKGYTVDAIIMHKKLLRVVQQLLLRNVNYH